MTDFAMMDSLKKELVPLSPLSPTSSSSSSSSSGDITTTTLSVGNTRFELLFHQLLAAPPTTAGETAALMTDYLRKHGSAAIELTGEGVEALVHIVSVAVEQHFPLMSSAGCAADAPLSPLDGSLLLSLLELVQAVCYQPAEHAPNSNKLALSRAGLVPLLRSVLMQLGGSGTVEERCSVYRALTSATMYDESVTDNVADTPCVKIVYDDVVAWSETGDVASLTLPLTCLFVQLRGAKCDRVAVGEWGAAQLCATLLSKFHSCASIVTLAAGVLQRLVLDLHNVALVQHAGGVENLLSAWQTHRQEEAVVRRVTAALTNIFSKTRSVAEPTRTELCRVVLGVLQSCTAQTSSDVVNNVCSLVGNLCMDSDALSIMAACGVVQAVVEACRQRMHKTSDVLRLVTTLGHLCAKESVKLLAYQAGCVQLLADLLRRCLPDCDMCQRVVCVLGNLSYTNDEVRLAIVTSGAMALMVESARLHIDDEVLASNTLRALGNLALVESLVRVFVALGVVTLCCDLQERHGSSARVCEFFALICTNLFYTGHYSRELCGALVGRLSSALVRHENERSMVTRTLMSMANVCNGGDGVRLQVEQTGVFVGLQRLVELHAASHQCTRQAVRFVHAWANDAARRSVIVQRGIIPPLLSAIQEHVDDPALLKAALTFLVAFADNESRAALLDEHGAVDMCLSVVEDTTKAASASDLTAEQLSTLENRLSMAIKFLHTSASVSAAAKCRMVDANAGDVLHVAAETCIRPWPHIAQQANQLADLLHRHHHHQ